MQRGCKKTGKDKWQNSKWILNAWTLSILARIRPPEMKRDNSLSRKTYTIAKLKRNDKVGGEGESEK
jgi:hypothetical protein